MARKGEHRYVEQIALFSSSCHPFYDRISPRLIAADPNQPRSTFDPLDMDTLISSITALGVVEPLVVEEATGGRYRLIAGERRLRATLAVLANQPDHPMLQAIPVLVYPMGLLPETARVAMQLSENFFRKDLTPGETARGLRRVRSALECAQAESLVRHQNAAAIEECHAAEPDDRERILKTALMRAGTPWPTVSWNVVFRLLGMDPSDRSLRRVKQILSIPDPVLDRCDELGLTRSAAAALSELRDEKQALDLLDAVGERGDPGVVTPAVDLLLADPSLDPSEAVTMVFSARRATKAARKMANAGVPKGQFRLEKPLCPSSEFERVVASLRGVVELLGTYSLSEYQCGSIRLLLERITEQAVCVPVSHKEQSGLVADDRIA